MTERSPLPIGLELYTVRNEVAQDMQGTLRRVAVMGYDGVEFAGYAQVPAEEMRDLLREIDLTAAATHVGLDRLDADFDGEAEYCRTIGCDYLVLPSLPDRLRGAENLDAATALLNDLGRRCRDAGLRFGYHNHDFEWAVFDGSTLWERMVEETDPGLVTFELDVYWVGVAGRDPRQVLAQYQGRIPVVHFKDMAPDGRYTEVGAGTLRLEALYQEAPGLGIEWAVVELDNPTIPPLESAVQSLAALHRARGEA